MSGVTSRVPRYSSGLGDLEWNCRAPVSSGERVVPRAAAWVGVWANTSNSDLKCHNPP